MKDLPIYELLAEADKVVSLWELDPAPIFNGRRLLDSWKAPRVRVRDKGKPLRDFVSWVNSAPVVGPKAAQWIQAFPNEVELLPLVIVQGKQLFAANVTNVVNCVDAARSTLERSLPRFVFDRSKLPEQTLFFKVPQYTHQVFVTRRFVSCARQRKLTGITLMDPSANPFSHILLPRSPDAWKL